MSLRPPSSTLFPYTTLFRSEVLLEGPEQLADVPAVDEAVIDRRRDRHHRAHLDLAVDGDGKVEVRPMMPRSEEHTSELQSHVNLVCRLLLEKKKKNKKILRQ